MFAAASTAGGIGLSSSQHQPRLAASNKSDSDLGASAPGERVKRNEEGMMVKAIGGGNELV